MTGEKMRAAPLKVLGRFFAVGLAAMTTLSSQAWADIPGGGGAIVLDARNAEGLKRGMEFKSGDEISLPSNGWARIFFLDGATRELRGPLSQPIEEIRSATRPLTGMYVRVRSMLVDGYKRENARVASRAAELSINSVPITGDGSYCFAQGAPLSIARVGGGAGDLAVQIIPSTGRMVETQIPAGASSTRWPGEAALRQGASYAIALEGSRPFNITLRFMSGGARGGALRETLAQNGCDAQLLAEIERVTE